MRLLNTSIVSGQSQVTGNGELLRLTGTNHAYLSFYNNGSAGARGGYIGFPGSSVTYVTLVNEVSGGHISLSPGTNGNVGIGTNSPGAKLEVNGGNIRAIFSSGPQVFVGTATNSGTFLRNDNSLNADFISSTDPTLGEVHFIKSTRDSTSGTLELQPFGTSGFVRVRTGRSASNSSASFWDFRYDGILGLWKPSTGSWGWSISDTGFLAASSDIRLKSNISSLSYGLNEVLSINPISYNFKGSEKRMIGLNAAEINNLMPEVVSKIGDDPDGGNNPLLGIGYSEIIPVLINAIKELSAEVESLKAKIN